MYTNYGPGPSAFGLSMGIYVTAAILVGIKAWQVLGVLYSVAIFLPYAGRTGAISESNWEAGGQGRKRW